MNILVLGGTRLMGKHLVKELTDSGNTVTIFTRGISADGFGHKVRRITGDRTKKEDIINNIPKESFDVVFDSLAYCSNDVKYLLDNIRCKRYVQISSASVYEHWHRDMRESEFDPIKNKLVYCDRADFTYDIIKRQAESAIVQNYPDLSAAMVRFPFVIGEDDYTDRLYFYIDHIVNQKPMHVDNINSRMSFILSHTAGEFLCFLGEKDFKGPINAANTGSVSIKELADYVRGKTGKEPVFSENGDSAPYNGAEEFNLNTEKAQSLGFDFPPIQDVVYSLLDKLIKRAEG